MTKEEVLKANLELQSRIKNQDKIITRLKDEISELKFSNNNLTLDKNDLLKKINHKEQIITQYQNNKPTKDRVNLEHNKKVVKRVIRRNKSNDDRRVKMIYGILKNKLRYNLSQTEIIFLESIKDRETITPKQQTWYNDILLRGK